MSRKLKVAVGMSGGVDSGVSAKLLVDAGYDVAGVHLHFWAESVEGDSRQNKCCSTESLMAARRTCDMLGIPFYTFNFEDIFKQTVVEYFLEEYKQNRTPNPCVVCNRKIKTGRLVKYVQGLGFDMLATGHYIRLVQRNEEGDQLSVGNFVNQEYDDQLKTDNCKLKTYREIFFDDMEARAKILNEYPNHKPMFLKMGEDKKKDQSYFLYTMKQEDLVRLVFPLANMTKDQTRQLAKDWNLPVATSKESFEICFIPTDDHTEFLSRHMDQSLIKVGDVVTEDGEVIGTHRGLPFYSMGQRRGFTSRKPIPFYVIGKNVEKNQLIVGNVLKSTRSVFTLERITWADESISLPMKSQVRMRNMGGFDDVEVYMNSEEVVEARVDVLQRGISPGQSAVFYDGDVILGGGVIGEVIA